MSLLSRLERFTFREIARLFPVEHIRIGFYNPKGKLMSRINILTNEISVKVAVLLKDSIGEAVANVSGLSVVSSDESLGTVEIVNGEVVITRIATSGTFNVTASLGMVYDVLEVDILPAGVATIEFDIESAVYTAKQPAAVAPVEAPAPIEVPVAAPVAPPVPPILPVIPGY